MTRGARAAAAAALTGLLLGLPGLVACSASPGDDGGPGAEPSGPTSPQLPADQGTAAAGAPNIVLITTDDQTASDMRWMPQTRSLLGRRGVTFTQSLAPHPLCCPARAEILTGQYAHNNGVLANNGAYGGIAALRQRDNTIAPWLWSAGYHTGLVGKFLNGYNASRDGYEYGWEEWSVASTSRFGYDDFTMFIDGEIVDFPRSAGAYSSDVVTDETEALVRQWAGAGPTDQPFFVWASYYAPHPLCASEEAGCETPPVPAPEHADELRGVKAPTLRKPSWRARLDGPNPEVAGHTVVGRRSVQRMFTGRIQALQSVDDGVARIVRALDEVGELDNTLLVFTSDNGYLNGEHRYTGKTLAYEESLRVPLIIRGPGLRPGAKVTTPVTTVDLAPTIAAAAGAEPGRPMDGRDLRAVVKRPRGADTVLVQAGFAHAKAGARRWAYRGVRTSRYTFLRWPERTVFEELYDRKRDPFQLRNLALDPRYAPVRAELRERLAALQDCAGPAACFRRFGPVPRPTR